MMRRLVVTATMLVAATSAVHAQGKDQPDFQCRTATLELRDACQKAVDLFNYMTPQLGTAMAGGNATLGNAHPMGGLGHFSLGVRATAVLGTFPDFENAPDPSTTGAVSTHYEMEDVPVPMPAVDLAIGLFKGIPIGITRLGGLDLLLSAAYVPEIDKEGEEFSLLTPDGSLKLGFGAKLGIFNEGKFRPGISATYLQRGLPTMTIGALISDGSNSAADDSVAMREIKFDASSWRLVVHKKLMFLHLAGGYGMDTYNASGDITAVVKEPCPANPAVICRFSPGVDPATNEERSLVDFDQSVSRSNLFANAVLNLVVVKLAAEVGQVSGGTIKTFNTFETKPDASRQYASFAIRIGF